MSKQVKIYLAIFIVVVGLMMYLEYTRPKPLDWTRTFSAKDKIPFGAYVLANELPKLFPDKDIQFVENETLANFLMEDDDILTGNDGAFFILGGVTTKLSETDCEMLLEFVSNGNDVFLSKENTPHYLEDTLKLRSGSFWYQDGIMDLLSNQKSDSVYNTFVNSSLDTTKYRFSKQTYFTFFNKCDTSQITVLGEYRTDSTNLVNFIKMPFGKGNFYLHLFPDAFGNYYMLNDTTYLYTVSSLNYLRKDKIYVYEYKKSLKARDNEGLLMYIFANPPLYWAWVILLVGAIIYLLFAGKRVQRIIPVIEPLQNSTVEFTKTVGDMYYNSHQHNDLMQKKIKYLLYFIKETYFLDIKNTDDEFSRVLSLKSGVSQKTTDKIIYLINKINSSDAESEDDLKTLNDVIDKFYGNIKTKKQ